MKVFLSWSGERSQALAQALRDWLPLVLHYVDPWLSQSDIEAGERWANKVAKELEASTFGVLAITRENVASPWILFEAGALARSMEEGRVIPLLFDLDFKDITGPLAQFQAKKVERSGIVEVVTAINKLSEQSVPDARLTELLDMAWPALEKKVQAIPKASTAAKHNRPSGEVLEELVASVRGLDARVSEMRDVGFEGIRRRMSRHDPGYLLDAVRHLDSKPSDPMRILMLASVLKDDAPWIYELAVDVYRNSSHGPSGRGKMQKKALREELEKIRHGPLIDVLGRDRRTYVALRELTHALEYDLREVKARARPRTSPPVIATSEPSSNDGDASEESASSAK